MTYLDPDLIADETSNAEAILAGFAERIDGWDPAEGSPETDLAEATGIILATIAALALDAERADYEGFGVNILGIPRGGGDQAEALSTWTFTAAGTYTIPDGSEVILDAADGTPWAFATVGDVTVTGTEATGVPVVALEAGADANGITGEGRDFEALPFVESVTLTTEAAGGAEVEERDAYLDRVADRARRLKAVPIDVDDYAALALDHPSVARALAVRLLDPGNPPAPGDDPSSGGHITVFPIDATGQPSSAGVQAEVVALLEGADRPLAIVVHTADAEYTDLAPAVSIRLERDADHDATIAAVQAAITSYLDPALYGFDRTAPGRWRGPASDAERLIRHYDIAHVADSVPGVAGVTAATINGTTDVTLDGWAPLPNLTGPPAVTVVT